MTIRRLLLCAAFLSIAPALLSAQCPDGSPPPCRAARVTPAPRPNSVAVLYFDNLSRDTADAYLADGLTEEIIVSLGQIDRLAVKSRTAARRLRRHSNDDPAELGRALDVRYLVSGSVRRSGERVRVSVELVRAANGLRLWGESFDRASSDLLAIEEDIARAVATAIAGRLAPPERAALAARPTRSAAAYDRFLRGNYALAQRSEKSLGQALEAYEAALRLDPNFTSALARIALVYGVYHNLEVTNPGVPAESLLTRGLDAADRALGRDPSNSDAWMARGFLLEFRNPLTLRGVREAFERAIALDPENAEAHHHYGVALLRLGDDAGAAAAYRRALALDPERPITLRNLAHLRLLQRAYPEALRWADSALAVDSTFANAYVERADARRLLGDTAGARHDALAVERYASASIWHWAEATRVFVDASMGDTAAARARAIRMAERIESLDSTGRGIGYREGAYTAMALAVVGESNRALSILERARRWGLLLAIFFRSPEFDTIRDQPRFRRLAEELKP